MQAWSYGKFYGWKVLGYSRCSVVFSCTIVVYCGFVLVIQTGNYILIRDRSNFGAEAEECKPET